MGNACHRWKWGDKGQAGGTCFWCPRGSGAQWIMGLPSTSCLCA